MFERADPCDPARIVSRAHGATPAVVDAAVAAARAAQPAWAATPLADRIAALRRIATLIAERRVEIAGVVSAETGKVRMEAVPEVQEGADLINTYCAAMEEHDGYRIPLGSLTDHDDNVSVMRPYGVFAVICPFNFPFALAVNMAAGALVCGNTVVIKPAEETPWSTHLVAELAAEAICRRASSTSSTATTWPGARWSTRRSTASRSPARPRPATRSRTRCTRSRRCVR